MLIEQAVRSIVRWVRELFKKPSFSGLCSTSILFGLGIAPCSPCRFHLFGLSSGFSFGFITAFSDNIHLCAIDTLL